jgi:hypothetical protein
VLNLEDCEKVRALYARYAHVADQGQAEAFARCFTPDGIFDLPNLGRSVGRQQIAESATKFNALLQSKGATQRHLMSNVSFELDGDQGDGTCNLSHYLIQDRAAQLTLGIYQDKLKKIDGEWYFASRSVAWDTKLSRAS